MASLLEALTTKGYFDYPENAEAYHDSIANFMNSIPDQKQYYTKRKKYGEFYCRYKPNRNTTWYVTFDTDGEVYIIRNLINNHTKDYSTFINGL